MNFPLKILQLTLTFYCIEYYNVAITERTASYLQNLRMNCKFCIEIEMRDLKLQKLTFKVRSSGHDIVFFPFAIIQQNTIIIKEIL